MARCLPRLSKRKPDGYEPITQTKRLTLAITRACIDVTAAAGGERVTVRTSKPHVDLIVEM